MPKSEILLLRRWPCWPGPYSRRLTGLLGRPKTFSPMRRSSLYLALVRLLTLHSPIRVSNVPGPHQRALHTLRPPLHRECGINCEGARLGTAAAIVKFCCYWGAEEEVTPSGFAPPRSPISRSTRSLMSSNSFHSERFMQIFLEVRKCDPVSASSWRLQTTLSSVGSFAVDTPGKHKLANTAILATRICLPFR